MAITRDALGIAYSIQALPLDLQRRVLKLVELMLIARDEARKRAQLMIREAWSDDYDAQSLNVASIDATILYLEQHTDPARLN